METVKPKVLNGEFLYGSYKRKREQKHREMRAIKKLCGRMSREIVHAMANEVMARHGHIPATVAQLRAKAKKLVRMSEIVSEPAHEGVVLTASQELKESWLSLAAEYFHIAAYMDINNITK